MLLNRKIKKSGEDPKGMRLRLFCPLPRQGHGGVAVPLVSSPSSCCASNLPQAGPVDQADTLWSSTPGQKPLNAGSISRSGNNDDIGIPS
jgi:hypothetical protein